jgi:hypothetical protein
VAAAVVEGEKPRAHDANANDHRDNLSMALEEKRSTKRGVILPG